MSTELLENLKKSLRAKLEDFRDNEKHEDFLLWFEFSFRALFLLCLFPIIFISVLVPIWGVPFLIVWIVLCIKMES